MYAKYTHGRESQRNTVEVWYGMVWYGRGTEGTRGGREGGRQGLVRMQVGTKECKCLDYTNGPKFGFEQLTR